MSRSRKSRAGAAPTQGRGGKKARGRDLGVEEGAHLDAPFLRKGGRGRVSPTSRGSRRNSNTRSPLTFLQSSSLGDWHSPFSAPSGSQSGGGSSESRRKFIYRARGTGTLNSAAAYVYSEARGTNESLQQQEIMSRSEGRAGAAPTQGRGGKEASGRDLGVVEGAHLDAPFARRGGRASPTSRGSRHNSSTKSARSPLSFLRSSSVGDWHSPFSAPSGSQSGGGSSESRRKSIYRARGARTLNSAVAYVYSEARGTNESLQQQEVENSPEIILPASEGRAAVIMDRCPVRPPVFDGSSTSESVERAPDSSYDMNELYRPSMILVQNKDVKQSTPQDSESGVCDNSSNSQYAIKKQVRQHIKLASIEEVRKKQAARNYRKKTNKLRPAEDAGDSGFLCIGGVRIFTDRASDWFETQDDIECGEEDEVPLSRFDQRRKSRKKYKPKFRQSSSQSECSDETDDLSSTDIDDDIAEDYIAGVEGDFMDVDGLLQTPGAHHEVRVEDMGEFSCTTDDSSNSSDDSRTEEVSGCDGDLLQALLLSEDGSASDSDEERSSKAEKFNLENLKLECSSDEDEGTALNLSTKGKALSKAAARKQIKQLKAGKLFPLQSAPGSASSKKDEKAPGSKKWQRTEMIARKRHERAMLRGFDLSKINAKLESIVINNVDIFAFEPMGKTDCLQVQKLASVYRLKSGSQGSGKRRFVVVTRTVQTALPSGHDKARLEEILRLHKNEDNFAELPERGTLQRGEREKRRLGSKARRATRQAFQSMKGGSVLKQDYVQKMPSSNKKATKRSAKKAENYASQPLTFVSSGIIRSEGDVLVMGIADVTNELYSDDNEGTPVLGLGIGTAMARKCTSVSPCIGEFEAHTKGFGSRMMAKMGYVDGTGLGKDGQGVAQPLQAIKRPKSLGLGA